MKKCIDRLNIEQYGHADGNKVILSQTHRNGSSEIVGKIELDGGELDDAIYLLAKAKDAAAP